jgi:predicted dehydrogenase
MSKLLVVGCGSIGMRHIRNLLKLGVGVAACDVDLRRLEETTLSYGLVGYANLEAALEEKWDGVVIASPSIFHYSQTMECLNRGFSVFVEKPMATSVSEARMVEDLSIKRKSILLNGFNMRFHPSIIQVKQMLDKGLIGRVFAIRVMAGYYLPDWHPERDYRQEYSARADLGGGALWDGIHELDYIRYFFGEVEQVYCVGGKQSDLEIDTEDMAELVMRCFNGAYAEVHLNYLNRTRLREFVIVGENGIIKWDSNEQSVKLFETEDRCWKVYNVEFEFQINDTYVLEMKHFLRCICGEEESINGASDGRASVEIISCAKESMRTGKPALISNCANVGASNGTVPG